MAILAQFANAVITLATPGGGVTVDPETGNVLPVVNNATYDVYLKLEDKPTSSDIEFQVGVNQFALYASGYLADNTVGKDEWPDFVSPGTSCTVHFKDKPSVIYDGIFHIVNGNYGTAGIGSLMPKDIASKFKMFLTTQA